MVQNIREKLVGKMAGIPIESLNLSVRATNVLHRMNIHEVEQLLNIPIEYIAEQRNMGVKTIAEIKGAVRQINIGDMIHQLIFNLIMKHMKKDLG